jgi:hypothetical protein
MQPQIARIFKNGRSQGLFLKKSPLDPAKTFD